MSADEVDALQGERLCEPARNFGLTISPTALLWKSNEYLDFQGHYDYQAHAHVLPGGADPLESRGYASVASSPDKL
jgi:hypothetical protein